MRRFVLSFLTVLNVCLLHAQTATDNTAVYDPLIYLRKPLLCRREPVFGRRREFPDPITGKTQRAIEYRLTSASGTLRYR